MQPTLYWQKRAANLHVECNTKLCPPSPILPRSAKSMKIIIPNIWMLLLRIALLAVFSCMFHWHDSSESQFWLGLVFFLMFPIYLTWTLLGVMWVTISHDYKLCRFYYLYKWIDVNSSDPDSYYSTQQYAKLANFKGLLIKIKSGKTIEVTEYNLSSIKVIKKFLSHHRVPMKGDKRSWFPITRQI